MDSSIDNRFRHSQMIFGAAVFLVSLIAYIRTIAPTTSFWDCGEFIACSYILGVMHPPGAPLYMLIGRIMTMLPVAGDIGLRVNLFSALVSALSVWFTYLIVLQLIKRWRGEAKSGWDQLILISSGLIGALALAFSDSFWFNAVEAEVYAFSMFFTALVIWLALRWGERSQAAGNVLLIFFIFYMLGLAAGVHLLNILVFPFVMLIVFFHDNQKARRLMLLLAAQALVPFFLYVVFYQYNPAKMTYANLLAHQARAASFLKWFGLIWLASTLVYIYLKDKAVFRLWLVIPVLMVVAVSVYLAIYIRANMQPPINENDPSTLPAMMDYLSRKQYGTEDAFLTFLFRKADFWNYQIQLMYTRYFAWQFIGKGTTLDAIDRIREIISLRGLYGLPFLLGLWGAVHHFFRDWKRGLAVLILFILTGIGIILYVNQPDPQPRERDYSYVGSFFAFALWIGIGLAGLLEWLSDWLASKKLRPLFRKIVLGTLVAALFAAVPVNMFAFNFHSHDRSGNYVAWDYSYNILQTCEPDAVVFTNGDNDTFPLWYLQEVEGIRKDVRVVNLSLLNTSWYIKQLRDHEPRVPIGLTDRQIEEIGYFQWETRVVEIPVPEEELQKARNALIEDEIEIEEDDLSPRIRFTVEPTFPENNPQALRVQDLMILRILEQNRWRRPIYFAVTVSQSNQLGLYDYLRMDGLAYKVVPYKVRSIDPDILRENLLNKFQYRGLNDPDVYLNTGIIKLLINVRQAFLQLAGYYIDHNQDHEALDVLDEMEKRIPGKVVPYSHEAVALSIAEHFQRAGRQVALSDFTSHILKGTQVGRRDRIRLANYYSQIFQDWEKAEEICRELIQADPDDVEAYSVLFNVYRMSRQYGKGIELLEDWLLRYPGDQGALREMENMKRLAGEDTAEVRQ
ncbi:MAG TPA: DUF2723 domain-containing protein [bacterium]|nr:DUF2723 domain-containing protein [bacterium]